MFFLDQGKRAKFSKWQTALEFPHPPVYEAGNQNTERKRKDKQYLPLFLPSLGNVICITLSAFHLICLGLGSAVNMKSKQSFTSKEKAVIFRLLYIYFYI